MDLILEFTVGSATVAVGEGGVVNVPAIVVVLLLTGVLVRGIRPTARVNAAIVAVTI